MPVRHRRAPREPRFDLYRGWPNQDDDPQAWRGGRGHSGAGPLSADPRRAGVRRPGRDRRPAWPPGRHPNPEHPPMSASGEPSGVFGASRQCFEEMAGWLDGREAATLTHAEIEDQLDRRGRELLRRMFQEHLELRAVREQRARPVGRLGRREQPPDPPPPNRSPPARNQRHHRRRLHPRARVPVGSGRGASTAREPRRQRLGCETERSPFSRDKRDR
jgi:hypothetical protein